jgi:hypothetical protein
MPQRVILVSFEHQQNSKSTEVYEDKNQGDESITFFTKREIIA